MTGPDLQLCKARIFNVLRKLTVVPWEAHAKVKLGSQEPFGMGVAREVGIKWIQRGSLLIESIEYNLLPVLYVFGITKTTQQSCNHDHLCVNFH